MIAKQVEKEIVVLKFKQFEKGTKMHMKKRLQLFKLEMNKFDAGTELLQLAPMGVEQPEVEVDKRQLWAEKVLGSKVLLNVVDEKFYKEQIKYVEKVQGKHAVFGEMNTCIPEQVSRLLVERNIKRLYEHQTIAIDAVMVKKCNVMLTTKTNSGKSLTYLVPTLSSIVEDPDATALFIFPTKALAQDQLRSLMELIENASFDIKCNTFVGIIIIAFF